MEVTPPFWFKQRQCKYEPAGSENTLKVSGPNLSDAYISIRPGPNQLWQAELRLSPDGPVVAATPAEIPDVRAAWDAAFELYRSHMIV